MSDFSVRFDRKRPWILGMEQEASKGFDIDLIFGGCVNCNILDNVIWHTDNFAGGSFAALMIHAWSDGNGGNATSGNFSGSLTSGNSIDCGAQRRCGIGLYLGSDAWYITDVYGGSVHDNTVANAEMGVLIDDVHDMEVYDNPVSNPAPFTTASCGQKWTHAYAIGDRSANINGRKCFITNGSLADFIVVYAYTAPDKGARGMSAFVVEKGTPGLAYGKNERKMGMRGSVNSELLFDDMRVPASNLIGVEGNGFGNLLQTLSINRLFCAAQAVGIARGALDRAVSFARERVQFGKPIAYLGPIQFMIADMATAVEAARLLTRQAAVEFDRGDTKAGALHGGMAKVLASDSAMRVTTDAVQIMGGYGYMKDYPVERMMRDAKLTQIYTGTNQIARMVTGRALLK